MYIYIYIYYTYIHIIIYIIIHIFTVQYTCSHHILTPAQCIPTYLSATSSANQPDRRWHRGLVWDIVLIKIHQILQEFLRIHQDLAGQKGGPMGHDSHDMSCPHGTHITQLL